MVQFLIYNIKDQQLSKVMIEQSSNHNTVNYIRPQLLQLLGQPEVDPSKINTFMIDILQSERNWPQDHNLKALTLCICQLMNDRKGDALVEGTIVKIVVILLQEVVHVEARYGGMEAGVLIGDEGVRDLVTRVLLDHDQSNPVAGQLRAIMAKIVSGQFMEKVSKYAMPPSISAIKNINMLGVIQLLASVLYFSQFIQQKSDKADEKKFITTIDNLCHAFMREKLKSANEIELKLFLDICFDYHDSCTAIGLDIKDRCYDLAWRSILNTIQMGSLQKKLSSIQSANYFVDHLKTKNQNLQLISMTSLTKLVNIILEPRNHQEILNRSVYFLSYWLSVANEKQKLDGVLKQWFNKLFLKSDSRSSNLFIGTWHRLIMGIQQLGLMQAGVLYENALALYQLFFKTRLRNQDEKKAASVLGPLINKQFKPYETHEQNTFLFLKTLWDKKTLVFQNFAYLIEQQMKTCITSAISPRFNIYALGQKITTLFQLVRNNNVRQNDQILSGIQPKITEIYTFISCFLFSLQNISAPNSSQIFIQRMHQIRQKGLSILTNKQCLNNLIICHNSSSRPQLQKLLGAMTLIIKEVNDQKFQSQQLEVIRRKVDNSDEFFIRWLRDRLNSIKNHNFKMSVMAQMFKSPQLYNEITQSALQTLLQILLIYDQPVEAKRQFAIQMLKHISPGLIKKSINLILSTLWTRNQHIESQMLKDIYKIATEIRLQDWIQISLYNELIKSTQEIYENIDILNGERVVGQSVANERNTELKIKIFGDETLQKAVTCSDSLPFWKWKIEYLHPILLSASVSHSLLQSIAKIQYNGFEVTPQDIHSSLCTLNEKYPAQPLGEQSPVSIINNIAIKLANKNHILLKNIKESTLHHIVFQLYAQNSTLTFNLVNLCTRMQLKGLLKYMNKIGGERLNLEELLKQQMLELCKKSIKGLLDEQTGFRMEKIANQLAELIKQIDKGRILAQKSVNLTYSPRKLLSSEQYFLQKAIKLLQVPYQINQSHKQQSKLVQNPQKISFQFLNKLVATKQLENIMISGINSWIKNDPQLFPYLICFGFQVLWIALKDHTVLIQFIRSQLFYEVFQVMMACVMILSDNKKIVEELRPIYAKIALTGLKIFNKVIRLSLMIIKNLAVVIITRKPQDILDMNETKKNIEQLKINQSVQALIKQDSQATQALTIAQIYKDPLNFRIETKATVKCILAIYQIMEDFDNNIDSNNVFMLFYEASRLNCWMIVLAGQEEQTQMITFLTRKLNSKCKQLSLVCKSLLFIYMNIDNGNNCNKILQALFQTLHSPVVKQPTFYDLFSECFTFCESQELVNKIIETFFSILMDLKPEKANQSNESLCGILSVIRRNAFKLSRHACEAFLGIMLNDYLFYCHDQVKAFLPKSRESVYSSLEACLVQHSQISTQELFTNIKDQIRMANRQQDDIKDNKMGVGLQNLGNICYMNSMLQLLHSIKPFVSGLCSIKTQFSLLTGLQKLFISLSESVKKSISPEELLFCFDPPVDVGLQEDTTQFMISFLDKLQSGQKSGKMTKLAKSIFHGETSSNFVCDKCGKGKQITQSFYLFNLPIENQNKHFKNLQQCLQNLKVPEIIYDVNCQTCGGMTNFAKNIKLKTIPTYFLVHLRRLIFDYKNPYVKTKVHTRLEFPETLTLNNEKLVLKGVITHSGTGQYGHYFTSLKQGQSWVVYNDSKVYPLPHNGKQNLWYGSTESMGNDAYSTNAYVLLYQKQSKTAITNSSFKFPQLTETLKQVKQSNKSLMTKELLFGNEYRNGFINFAFNIAKLPNSPSPLTKIYQLLALVSYIQGAASTNPNQYFSSIKHKGNENIQELFSTIFQYKQHNNRFYFHKNPELREFFVKFMVQVFELSFKPILQGKCKLALVYACQIVNNCVTLLKQQQNFVYSSQYIKIIAFLIQKLNKNEQFLGRFYQSKIIPQLLKLYKSRSIQVKMNFISTSIQLMQPLIQLLLSFIMIIGHGQQDGTIVFFNEYQQNFKFIKEFFGSQSSITELTFMANSNFDYCSQLFNFLQLSSDKAFGTQLVGILEQYFKNFEQIDSKTSKNVCYIVWFIEQQFYSHSELTRLSFCQSTFGMVFASITHQIALDSRISSLRERNYKYLTNKLEYGLIQTVSRLLLECLNEPKVKIQNVVILNNFLKLILQFIRLSPIYLDYFSNLCAPICIYGDYYVFLMACIQDLGKKIELGLIGYSGEIDSLETQRSEFKQIMNDFRTILSQRKSDNEPVLCGKPYKRGVSLMENQLNELFVFVEEHENYWVQYNSSGKSRLLEFVDEDYKICPQFNKNEDIQRILKPSFVEKIEQQGQTMHQVLTNESQRDIQQMIPIQNGSIRRKFLFTNVRETPAQFIVRITCNNMKNTIIEVILTLTANQNKQIWVQKKKLKQQWGSMSLTINGVQVSINSSERMDGMAAEGSMQNTIPFGGESMM